ncbi:hypothetical protein CSKR_106071 [Clonorchis sinensis]|uniref:Uncharacterized protein n=1 Tax=Clonorchis sinensis TaxID=79923 RepID=A0A419Q7H0_CLOSI|nr:hypothetical protein CSKR_106071 [Clonorchis sinensis]
MLHIDKAFVGCLKTGVQKTNEPPCALNGPKNILNSCRSQFVTIPWRIVATTTIPKRLNQDVRVRGCPRNQVRRSDDATGTYMFPKISIWWFQSYEYVLAIAGCNEDSHSNAPSAGEFRQRRTRPSSAVAKVTFGSYGERKLLNDKEKPDPGSLGESLDPVCVQVNLRFGEASGAQTNRTRGFS